jgi:hypothetical protein
MNQKKDPITGKLPYKGIVDCTYQIATKEGLIGFFNGFSAYYGRCGEFWRLALSVDVVFWPKLI